jgi:hypothetical protein
MCRTAGWQCSSSCSHKMTCSRQQAATYSCLQTTCQAEHAVRTALLCVRLVTAAQATAVLLYSAPQQ